MKGQYLFVRRAGEMDAVDLARFHLHQSICEGTAAPGGESFIGKLAGELVSHLILTADGNCAEIVHLEVGRELQGKRIGRTLLQEVARIIAAESGRTLAVRRDSAHREFFLRSGFIEEGLWLSYRVAE